MKPVWWSVGLIKAEGLFDGVMRSSWGVTSMAKNWTRGEAAKNYSFSNGHLRPVPKASQSPWPHVLRHMFTVQKKPSAAVDSFHFHNNAMELTFL